MRAGHDVGYKYAPHTPAGSPRNPPSNGSGLDDRLADDKKPSLTYAKFGLFKVKYANIGVFNFEMLVLPKCTEFLA